MNYHRFFILKAIKKTGSLWTDFLLKRRTYGLRYAWYSLMWWIGWYMKSNFLMRKANDKKQAWLDEYIENQYSEVIQKWMDKKESSLNCPKYTIWVFWAQGEQQMPELVHTCYLCLKRSNPDNMILLDMNNVRNYANIPEAIYNLLERGSINFTHFSDILRNTLLSQQGGLWIDATCWVPRSVPSEVSKFPFFSAHEKDNDVKWVSYLMGSNCINNVTFSFVRDMLIATALHDHMFPDYLYQDYLISYAYRHFPASKQSIDHCSDGCFKRSYLWPLMNNKFDEKCYAELITTDWVFKLSYKSYLVKEKEGSLTFYGKMIESMLKY